MSGRLRPWRAFLLSEQQTDQPVQSCRCAQVQQCRTEHGQQYRSALLQLV